MHSPRLRAGLAIATLCGSIGVTLLPVIPTGALASAACPGAVPQGQADPSSEPEPMGPVWCFTFEPGPTTRMAGDNDWVDSFDTQMQMQRLEDGDLGYRVFNNLDSGGHIGNGSQVQSQHFANSNHWMVDMTHNNGGADLSPDQAFRFENGRLVIEADVAAAIPAYASPGEDVWPEVLWSTSPTPTGNVVDGLYLYGQFGGSWVGGCRLHSSRGVTCAVQADRAIPVPKIDEFPCFPAPPTRVMEISGFQQCGASHFGGAPDHGGPAHAWRSCRDNQMDMYCRDRFRFEWARDSLTVYVNGVRYFSDAGWPADRQLPDAIASGATPVYVHFGEWADFRGPEVYRIHWDRLAVNPHDTDGSLVGPTASPFYCAGQPQDTCPMPAASAGASMPMPMPMDGVSP